MSLDVYLICPCCNGCVFERNITHNLREMAEAAGLYKHLWRPEDVPVMTAKQLIQPLEAGLLNLLSDPEKFKKLAPSNGWGSFGGLVSFVEDYLKACKENPEAKVEPSR